MFVNDEVVFSLIWRNEPVERRTEKCEKETVADPTTVKQLVVMFRTVGLEVSPEILKEASRVDSSCVGERNVPEVRDTVETVGGR